MPESGLVSALSPSQLPPSHPHHPGDHPHNLNYGNNNNNPSNNTQYFNSNNNPSLQYMNRSMNGGNTNHAHPPPPPGNPNHTPVNSNDQNNNSSNNANDDPRGGGGGDHIRDLPDSRRDLFEEIRNGGGHWSQLMRQVVLQLPSSSSSSADNPAGGSSAPKDDKDSESESQLIPLDIDGGSENGQFAYVGQVTHDINAWIAVGYLQPGDILLDILGQQVIISLFMDYYAR